MRLPASRARLPGMDDETPGAPDEAQAMDALDLIDGIPADQIEAVFPDPATRFAVLSLCEWAAAEMGYTPNAD